MKLLHIDSSILGANSVSRKLTADIVAAWTASHPGTQVDYLDVAANAPAHLGADALGFRTGQAATTEAQRNENAVSEALVSQFLAADVVVIGAPLYNFTIPTQLKAWIDRIAVAGQTFRYTEAGPEGLCGNKKVIVVSTSGGLHVGQPTGVGHEDYLKVLLGFFGITDIEFVRAHGLAYGDEARSKALNDANALISEQLFVAA